MSPEEAGKKLDMYLVGMWMSLLPHWDLIETIWQVKDSDRFLMALVAYLKVVESGKLDKKWTWDDEKIAAWKKTPERKEVENAVAAVAAKFAALPEIAGTGRTLTGGAKPRPLNKQIDYWNGNGSAKKLGGILRRGLLEEIQKPEYTDPPDAASAAAFKKLLVGGWPNSYLISQKKKEKLDSIFTTNAAPGLSDHGQMRAIDFHVKVPGGKDFHPGGDERWESSGMAGLLKKAIESYNAEKGRKVFDGPLKSPNEPWHYDYNA